MLQTAIDVNCSSIFADIEKTYKNKKKERTRDEFKTEDGKAVLKIRRFRQDNC